MLTEREILATQEMIQNEHLDVRAVTLGINLLDCASSDLAKVKDAIYQRITRTARNLVDVCDQMEDKFGIPVVNKRISVSPIATVGASLSSTQLIEVAQTLNQAAADVGVDFLGGFSALVEKGVARGDRALIDGLVRHV